MKKLVSGGASRLLPAAALVFVCSLLSGQVIIQNFPGVSLNDTTALGTGSTPPDTMGVPGPNQFAELVNGAFAVYSKTGAQQVLISDNQFWENAGISSDTIAAGLTDTRIIYDAASGRWFASEITLDLVGAQVLLGRSDTSDPAGTWQAVNFTSNTGTLSPDFDTLGVDATGVYIGINNFDESGDFTGVSFFSIPKADLVASPPSLSRMTRFDNRDDTVYGFSLQGVCNPDAGLGHGVMIAIDSTTFKVFDRTTINGSGGSAATLGTTVYIHNTYDAAPNPVSQPSGIQVDGGDDRFSAFVRQVNTNIYMANCILANGKDAVHWMVLKEANNTLLGEGIISDGTHDFFYPSIAANHSGKFLLAFNRAGPTSPTGNISIYAAVGTVSGSSVTVGSPFLIQQGTVSDFSISYDQSPYRWGDYSTTAVDPTDENLFWTIQEIPVASDAWGTQITLISLATGRPRLTITRAGADFNLSWPASTAPAYVLQAAPRVAPAITWTNVPNPVNIVSNQNVVSVTAQAPMYYRLKN